MLSITPEVQDLIDRALAEDLAFSDPTTGTIIDPSTTGRGVLRAKARGVLAGSAVALAVFQRVDSELRGEALLDDGAQLEPGQPLATVQGRASSILQAERTALNFVQRMSGIATATQDCVQAIQGCNARIIDTRKTVPGMRFLDKYAVRVGGGYNHRLNLADGILIKDNHLEAMRSQGIGLAETLRLALERASHTVKIEVEVTNLDEVAEAVEAGAHIIMLDNMPVDQMRAAVELVAGRASIEASGGITLDNVREVAETGVDLISLGSLTHSVQALDISLDLEIP